MRDDLDALLAKARAAEARLTNMIVQEVSLVDQAANLRRFVIVKRGDCGDASRARLASSMARARERLREHAER